MAELDNLKTYACASLSIEEREKKVASFVNSNVSWNLDYTRKILPLEVVKRILASTPPSDIMNSDVFAWRFSQDGSFTVSSAYRAQITDTSFFGNVAIWKHIWNWDRPQKIKFFLWLIVHNSLPTRSILLNKHITDDPRCPFGCASDESILHCLRDCKIAIYFGIPLLTLVTGTPSSRLP